MLSYLIRHLKGQSCLCVKQSYPRAHRPSIFGIGHNVIQRRNRTGKHKSKFKHKKDLYEILELSQKASSVQIKGAYFRLSKKYHPDINTSDDAAVKFAEIAEAYEILGKTYSRNLYDKGLVEEDDMRNTGHPDGWKAYRKGFKSYDGPPKRGRTSIYDFDAWTRSHYSEVFEKRNAEKRNFEEYQIEKQQIALRKKPLGSSNSSHSVAAVLFAIIVIYLFAFIPSVPPNNVKQESEIFRRQEFNKKRKEEMKRLKVSKDLETNLAAD